MHYMRVLCDTGDSICLTEERFVMLEILYD